MTDIPDYPEIVPKKAPEARGIDFCATNGCYYIIRSDLGVYMRCKNFHEAKDIEIFSLNQACQWGDHYLAGKFGILGILTYFYIIKGNEYRRVTDMSLDKDAVVYNLHPNCRGGTFYYSAFGKYYIVFADRGVYRRVKNMNTDKDAVEYSIHPAFQNGLYIWGETDYVYCLKQADRWGVIYHRSTNMNLNEDPCTVSLHESVLNFVPGGVAQTKGRAFGYWKNIKSFANDTDVPVDWERTIKKTIGFNLRSIEMSSIEDKWSVKLGAEYKKGHITEAISKFQFSLKAKYGGTSANTEQQEWKEITEESEIVKLHIPAHSKMYVWQYQLGFGQKKNLFSSFLQITSDSQPPEEPPKSPN